MSMNPPKYHFMFALVLLMFCAGLSEVHAADLRGSLLHDGSGHGLYFVYAFRLDLDEAVAGIDVRPLPGSYEIPDLTDDTYVLFSWRDINGDMSPSPGEPFGWLGAPLPRVIQMLGQDIEGLDIPLQQQTFVAEIQGNVLYNGTQVGRVWIVPHTTPVFSVFGIAGSPWTMRANGLYHCFVFQSGSYYLSAWLDVNGNVVPDEGEPVATTLTPVDVKLGGSTLGDIDLRLRDPFVAIESATWSGVKQLYSQ